MLFPNQRVRRIIGNDGCFPAVGSEVFVDTVVDTHTVTLKGCGKTYFSVSHFEPSGTITESEVNAKELIEALEVINRHNRVCPTAQMVSIEAHPAVDGGSVFLLGGSFDTNNPQELYAQMVQEVSKEAFQAQLTHLNTLVSKVL